MPVACICRVCQAPFVVKPSDILHGAGKHCSKRCADQAKLLVVPCVCLTCHTPFVAKSSDVRRGSGKYCSVPCYRQRTLQPLAERFWSSVLKTETCWLWQGQCNYNGYGKFSMGHTAKVLAHRLAYELTYGLILPGLRCLHHCDTPACVRPEHLFLGTNDDNMRDMVNKKRHGAQTKPARMPRGERHGNAKLTDAQIREMRRLFADDHVSCTALARAFGVNKSTVARIIHRQCWVHVTEAS